jgi:hypothetical protein
MPNSRSSQQLPPRGERFADPVARAVWAAVLQLDGGQQHLILDELRARLSRLEPANSHETRVRHAIGCLRECAEILGRSPSVADYRRLRAENPSFKWPPDSSLRTWLGGAWNDCLRRAQLAEVEGGDVVVVQLGSAIDEEEIKAALRLCAKELAEVPTFHRYLSWARKPETKAKPGRRPTSQSAFDRVFGGFRSALTASGLIDEALDEMPRSSRVRFASYFVDRKKCIAALQEVAELIGHPPRVREYNAVRERLLNEPSESLKVLPAASTIQKEFGTWDEALLASGLAALGGRATGERVGKRERSGPQVSTVQIVSCLVEAYLDPEVGEPFTSGAYKEWRTKQIAADRQAKRLRRIPSYHLIWERLGNWPNAVQIVYRAIDAKKTTPETIAASLDQLLESIVAADDDGQQTAPVT